MTALGYLCADWTTICGPSPCDRFSRTRTVGSEEARSVALTLASVRRSNGACSFPALRFHEGAVMAMRLKKPAPPGCGLRYAVGTSDLDPTSHGLVHLRDPEVVFARIGQARPGRAFPRTRMYGYFSKGTDPPSRPYSTRSLAYPDHLRQPPSPTHSGRRCRGHVTFITLEVLFGRPTTRRALLPISLALIGSLLLVPARNPPSPPGVTSWSSVPCRPQTPWYSGWMRMPSPP